MNVLSLFDGMSCGMLAMMEAGVKVDRYVAYEIDKYAVQTSSHNFPMIEHRGDVFQADFTEFEGFDWLVGGSPCTYWSIAQKNNRETEASGMGWELFSQYVRALREAKPTFFIYENNKSMSKAIRQSITETFGFDAICINSALVSAQNRQRLYWVGKRNADGTYSKVDIEQPEDRGILLRDILECGGNLSPNDKSYALTTRCMGAIPEDTIERHRHTMVAEPVGIGYRGRMDNGRWVKQYESNGTEKANALTTAQTDSMVAEPIGTTKDGKSYCLTAGYANGSGENIGNYAAHTLEKGCKSMVAEPVYIGAVPDNNGTYMNGKQPSQQYRVYDPDGKGVAVTTCAITNVPERVCCYPSPDGTIKNSQGMRIYSVDGKSVNITAQGGGMGAKTGLYAIPVECKTIINAMPEIADKFGYIPEMFNAYNRAEITDKAPTLSTGSMATSSCAVNRFEEICGYATPCEWDEDGKPIKAVSAADGKTYTVYEVCAFTPPHGWNKGIFDYEKFPNLTTGSSCRQQNVLVEPLTEENEHLLENPQAFCNQKYEVKNNYITIKGKQYPIKLPAGFYIIRKLTVRECMRLQTVPEWYEFPVSDSQAYKMLGNGWTVSVIAHLILSALQNNP